MIFAAIAAQNAEITICFMNIYKTTHKANCPNGNLADTYKITIKSQEMIMVEYIAKVLLELPPEAYHEQIATMLRNKLGAEIKVVGHHHGVKITCIRK